MAGQRESRYYASLANAQAAFGQIYREKTSARKGYREVSLASSNIGSDLARGKSAGEIGASTLAKTKRPAEEEEKKQDADTATTKKGRANKRSRKGEQDEAAQQSAAESKQQEQDDIVLDVHVRELIRYIYDEAKTKLTSSINAEVTAEGIRTPLGILSIEQVEQGEAILERIQQEVMRPSPRSNVLLQLSSEFFSTIPHRLGRTKADLQAAVIREDKVVKEKQELLQLMKDMLEVNSNAKSNVIFHDDTVSRYRALQAEITWLSPESQEYQKVAARVVESVNESHKRAVVLRNVFKVVRPNEQARFRHDVGNVQLLFHGSRLSNWVGLLSRGILMPKVVVAEGGRRTDAGWLGNGIYFGHADVANNYAAPGRKGTSLMFCNSVAIGRTKDFNAITYGMNSPPAGFDSCHGVMGTEFADHEYCVYDDAQQKVEYLLEVNRTHGGYF
jgi:poly [ADP-ribose] polymerase